MTTINSVSNHYENYYKCSEPIDIAQEFRDYKDLIASSVFHEHYEYTEADPSFAHRAIGADIDAVKYNILTEFCSVDQLTVEGELEKVNKQVYDTRERKSSPVPMPEVEKLPLTTLKRVEKLHAASTWFMHSKYRTERPITYKLSAIEPNTETLTPENDFLIYVRIYCPFRNRKSQPQGQHGTVVSTPKLTFNSLIALHGSQTLAELRDQISCVSDHSIATEMSKEPVYTSKENAKHVYKSGFFFIEDTFYNDFRDPTNKDNSRIIRDWAISRMMGAYKTARMETTTIGNLILRFGFPWVYQHQGNCEHLITFSNARLVNPADEINVACYPRIVRIKSKPKTYCMTCGRFSADWIILNHSRLPHDPCQQCDKCFMSYNYVRGRKIGSFLAYPYPRDNDLQQEVAAIRKKKAAELKEESMAA